VAKRSSSELLSALWRARQALICRGPETSESGRKLPLFSFIPVVCVVNFRSLWSDWSATGNPSVLPDRIRGQVAAFFPAMLKAEVKLPCQTLATANLWNQVVTLIRRLLRVTSWGLIWAPQIVRCAGQTRRWQVVTFGHLLFRRSSVRGKQSDWKLSRRFTLIVVDRVSSPVPADCRGNRPATRGRPACLLVIRVV
jgi:hypothetical protein